MHHVALRRRLVTALAALAGCLAALPLSAAVVWNKVYTGFSQPVEVTHAHDGSQRLFVAQQSGAIRIIKGGTVLPTPFLDLGGASGLLAANGEQGLLGIAFHPQHATNRQFYVDYTRKSDGATVIARYLASAGNPDVADAASGTVLLVIPQPEGNHNGGALKFGPDGFLYIGMGDGGGGNDPHGTIGNGQDKTTLLGKILRIDVDNGGPNPYSIPAGNPYAVNGGKKEIFAIGVRNPWRMSFDRQTGDFWIGDVGQGAVEEVDMLPAGTGAGTNFGWRIMEGNSCTGLPNPPVSCNDPSLTPPVLAYTHSVGCSVTGGYVYRGVAVPALVGRYLYGDFCSGRLWSAQRVDSGTWTPTELAETGFGISSFGEDEAGELYFIDYGNGDIYQFADSAANTPTLMTTAGPVAFGNVALGSSGTQTFNVTNAGGGTLVVATLTTGGTHAAEFVRTGTCVNGAMLTGGQSCTVTYTFTPLQAGVRGANVAITTNGGNATIDLTGTGVAAPVLAVSTAALAFGSVNVGGSSAGQTFSVLNTGNATLMLTALTQGGTNPDDFLRGGTCAGGTALAAGQQCTVTYTFNPTAAGARSASLAVASNGGNSTVALAGTGTTIAPLLLGATPTSYDFGVTVLGYVGLSVNVAVRNNGAAGVTLQGIAIQGSHPGDFLLQSVCAPGQALAPGEICLVNVAFHPLVSGARTATLVVAYGTATPLSVPLSGTGSTVPTFVADVVEYYHAGFDHYFMTSLLWEITALDAGQFAGWSRTQKSFKVWSAASAGTSPVCRYYLPPAIGDSHFFSASAVECSEAPVKFPLLVFESSAVMHAILPNVTTGACPAGTVPIYRVWNRRQDSNHRYTSDRAVRDAMVARGYVAEGYGPDAVVMCGPP